MTGLDREAREITLAPSFDAEGRQVTPERKVTYDTLVIAVGSTPTISGRPASPSTPSPSTRRSRRCVSTSAS